MNQPLVTVVGNRPQFIKMLPVSRAIAAAGGREYVIHTGQHYDDALSDVFFRELSLPAPNLQLHITTTLHGAMTGELLTNLEAAFIEQNPRAVLLYGDTNTTLAAAIAAAKLHIPIIHIEAGPRMYDMRLPEEVNRRMVDHVSTLLCCPDQASVANLAREGISSGVHFTGDVMFDSFLLCKEMAHTPSWQAFEQLREPFVLLTLHRPSNVDSRACLETIYAWLQNVAQPVLFPIHPRTQKRLEEFGLAEKFRALTQHVLTTPMGYLDTVAALARCSMVVTDSGGLQKEAYYAGKPAIVLLDETPWPDLKASRWQQVVGTVPNTSAAALLDAMRSASVPTSSPAFYGNGDAGKKIAGLLREYDFLCT